MADTNILIFGAGKIGRSFIGQLFGQHGYRVVFVEMDRTLVEEINRRNQYPVVIKGPDYEEKVLIQQVSAIHAMDRPAIAEAISEAHIMAVSVGKTALSDIASLVAEGLLEREQRSPGRIVDVILAENMRSAGLFFREKLQQALPGSYPLDDLVGLVETSIGKMVPIMSRKDLEEDPLQVFAEPYNTLILDKKGFKGRVPHIPQLALKENMKAWVDRKAFIHNLGHATAAYLGFLKHPDTKFMYRVLEDPEVFRFTRNVMQESAGVLVACYPDEFTSEELSAHIDDLLFRFMNRNLGDTVFRVGSDLKRKLGPDDRFVGIIRLAEKIDSDYGLILNAMALGFSFRARDEHGNMFPEDEEFHDMWEKDPDHLLLKICGLDASQDSEVIRRLKQHIFSPGG